MAYCLSFTSEDTVLAARSAMSAILAWRSGAESRWCIVPGPSSHAGQLMAEAARTTAMTAFIPYRLDAEREAFSPPEAERMLVRAESMDFRHSGHTVQGACHRTTVTYAWDINPKIV